MDKLNRKKIRQNIKSISQYGVSDIYIFEQLDSTNTWLLNHKQCGALCLAEAQSKGRGRLGRNWVSPATGNIYLSYCYCFGNTLPKTFSLSTLAVGVAICEALKDIGLTQHGLKWPNDIYVDNRKLGGVLLETSGCLQQIIIGIGINISIRQQISIDQPWCCLEDVLSTPIDRNFLVASLIKHVQQELAFIRQEKCEQFRKRWQQWDILQHKMVSVIRGEESMQGIVVDIDVMGQLGVHFEQFGLQYLNAAEIKIRC